MSFSSFSLSVFRFFLVVFAAAMLSGCAGGGGGMFSGWDRDDDDRDGKRGKRGDRDKAVVLINTFSVPAGKTDEAIAMWEEARDFLREQDGYISTRLHMSLGEDARYRLINIAKWETPEKFQAASRAMQASGVLRRIDGVVGDPNLYKVIRKDKCGRGGKDGKKGKRKDRKDGRKGRKGCRNKDKH